MNYDQEQSGQPATNGPTRPQSGAKSLMTVGILLVVIIALLAVLWARERAARITAHRDATAATAKYTRMQSALGEMLTKRLDGQIQPVQREDLPARQVDLNGRKRTLLDISAAAGQRMGFRPGDLVLVAAEVTTTQAADKPQEPSTK